MKKSICVWAVLIQTAWAQLAPPSYLERFDSIAPPSLPRGWLTTTNRSSTGDFTTSTSSPHSSPHAILSTNATVSQTLTSAAIDFSGNTPTKLDFYVSRSSSHTAGLLVDASLDDGATFPIVLGDTLRNSGTSSYMLYSLLLPSSIANQERVRFRWRIIANQAGGTSGTFRLDDVSVATYPSDDLALVRLQLLPNTPPAQPTTNSIVGATVKNLGSRTALGYFVHWFRDSNGNGTADPSEKLSVSDGPVLLPSDSVLLTVGIPALNAGTHRFIAVASYAADKNPANDTATVSITLGADPQSIVINEIMFDPLPGQSEWIEFYHRGSEPIDIARWKFSDRPTASGANTYTLTSSSVSIQPGDFIVASSDSSLSSQFPFLSAHQPRIHLFILNRASGFGFNNEGDDIILRDALGTTIDSVSFSDSWHHPDVSDPKGRSLERVNPGIPSNDRRNWSTSPSATGGTPGASNGIFTVSVAPSASLSVNPNPFSPDGDGYEDFCIIRYDLPLTTSVIRLSVFDLRGRLVRMLANTELSGSKGEIVWDGLDDGQQRLRIGPYILFIEAIDGQAGILATAKAVVVVATKL